MLTTAMDVLEQFPVRKSKHQKRRFRNEVQDFAQKRGYRVTVEKGSFGAHNVVIGNPDTAKYLVTAHYDTCAWMPVPNFITPCNFLIYLVYQMLITAMIFAVAILLGWGTAQLIEPNMVEPISLVYAFALLFLLLLGPANLHNANDNTSGVVTVLEIMQSLPENQRDKVCFVLFDLEEAGLIGSASYRSAHKQSTNRQMVLNLDCVGDGDEIVMFPTARLRRDGAKMEMLDQIGRKCGEKKLYLHKKGFAFCPSDQSNFPYGLGIMAFRRKKVLGLYCSRIHTRRDTILEQTNVNILRAALISLIGTAEK